MFEWLKHGKKAGDKKRALAFVDYEYWFYTYKQSYKLKPDPVAWSQQLVEEYEIVDIMIFADFSAGDISKELVTLRTITNTIIETGNRFNKRKKDMTDFIMLDYIYQSVAQRDDIDTYILFTGDGHFQSVVKYLVQKKQKEVVVYGVRDSFSNQLKLAATRTEFVPKEEEEMHTYYKMVIQNMSYVSNHPDIIPTFIGTADAVSNQYSIPRDAIIKAMNQMMEKGYLYQRPRRISVHKSVKIVAVNWEMVVHDGL